jgi:HEAT repeat protein
MTYTIDELRSMQHSGNYRGLLFALAAPDGFVRAEAMSRLTGFRNSAVREAAIRCLKSDTDHRVRAQACVVLRSFPLREEISNALRGALKDANRYVRGNAASTLAHLRARNALDDVLAMREQGIEPDIEDSVNMAIDILSTPDKSQTLLDLASHRDVEGIGKLFDCMLKPDHEEIETGLADHGNSRMLDVFRQWEAEGRLKALDSIDDYEMAKHAYARRLIEAYEHHEPAASQSVMETSPRR